MTTQHQELKQYIQDVETSMTLRFDELDARLGAIDNDLGAIKALLGRQPPINPQFVARCLGLTPSEGQIAAALAEGKTVYEIAAARRRAVGTVRWFLKQINGKLNISTQSQLVRRVLLLHGVPARKESDAE